MEQDSLEYLARWLSVTASRIDRLATAAPPILALVNIFVCVSRIGDSDVRTRVPLSVTCGDCALIDTNSVSAKRVVEARSPNERTTKAANDRVWQSTSIPHFACSHIYINTLYSDCNSGRSIAQPVLILY